MPYKGVVKIQKNNERPQILRTDSNFCNALGAHGLNLELVSQLPDSRDPSVLDLECLNSIQSMCYQSAQSNIHESESAVNLNK